jgi:hypothetical protein
LSLASQKVQKIVVGNQSGPAFDAIMIAPVRFDAAVEDQVDRGPKGIFRMTKVDVAVWMCAPISACLCSKSKPVETKPPAGASIVEGVE